MLGSCSSINKPLAISKTNNINFPWKAQSKQAAKADLSTLPLLSKARCLLKNYFSLFLTALLSPIAHSPLLFPPHSLSCLRLCRRLVLSSPDLALFSALLTVFLSSSCPFPSFSVSRTGIILSSSRRSMFNLLNIYNHSRWIMRPTWQAPPKKCLSQSDFQLICLPIWCDGNFEIHATACLSK